VLNRASKRASLADDRIEKALGRPISWRVPNSYNEVVRAINSGAPVDSRSSDFGAGIRNWAQGVAGASGNGLAAAQSQNGLFSLFSR
jgi:ABC-type taurine transport system substrate-binding protein